MENLECRRMRNDFHVNLLRYSPDTVAFNSRNVITEVLGHQEHACHHACEFFIEFGFIFLCFVFFFLAFKAFMTHFPYYSTGCCCLYQETDFDSGHSSQLLLMSIHSIFFALYHCKLFDCSTVLLDKLCCCKK